MLPGKIFQCRINDMRNARFMASLHCLDALIDLLSHSRLDVAAILAQYAEHYWRVTMSGVLQQGSLSDTNLRSVLMNAALCPGSWAT